MKKIKKRSALSIRKELERVIQKELKRPNKSYCYGTVTHKMSPSDILQDATNKVIADVEQKLGKRVVLIENNTPTIIDEGGCHNGYIS